MISHPSYSNPTIKEALCEIHFVLPKDRSWDPTLFGRFYTRIQNDFPEMEPVAESSLRLQLQSGRVEFMPARSRMRYLHASRNILLQLASGVLGVNVLPKYEGWDSMKNDINQVWSWAEEVLEPQGVSRVGLRYINFIPRSEPSERPSEWLSPNEYIALAVLDSLPGGFARSEIRTDLDRRSVVTLGEAAEEDADNLVLDIDCIAENLNSSLYLDDVIDSLHDNVWIIFESFMTQRLVNFLEGGEL